MLELKPFEAILLAGVIAVSVLIIENIIFINNNALDPLNCNECKVSVGVNEPKTEPFIGNIGSQLNEFYNDVVGKVFSKKNDESNIKILENPADAEYEYKCIKVLKPKSTMENTMQQPTETNILNENDMTEGFEQFMKDQTNQNAELGKNKQSMQIMETILPTEPNQTNKSTEEKPDQMPKIQIDQKKELVTDTKPTSNTKPTSDTKPASSTNVETTSENLSYSVNYVQYQKDGLEQEQDKESEKINKFRREIADQEAVAPWSKDGYKYYADIFTRSVGAPPANEALTNELKYGDYNYIGPINKGMINKEYTFVSPSNWYPIPPHPPVCVTNKSCTTCPVQISNGKDYMHWASWDEFDQARRFTGDMNINIDYVKNVLNNPNGY